MAWREREKTASSALFTSCVAFVTARHDKRIWRESNRLKEARKVANVVHQKLLPPEHSSIKNHQASYKAWSFILFSLDLSKFTLLKYHWDGDSEKTKNSFLTDFNSLEILKNSGMKTAQIGRERFAIKKSYSIEVRKNSYKHKLNISLVKVLHVILVKF